MAVLCLNAKMIWHGRTTVVPTVLMGRPCSSRRAAFGYDIWTKCVPHKVLDRRYYDDKVNKISFHVDHGEGMDVYAVGPTLGGGTAALLDSVGEICLSLLL